MAWELVEDEMKQTGQRVVQLSKKEKERKELRKIFTTEDENRGKQAVAWNTHEKKKCQGIYHCPSEDKEAFFAQQLLYIQDNAFFWPVCSVVPRTVYLIRSRLWAENPCSRRRWYVGERNSGAIEA